MLQLILHMPHVIMAKETRAPTQNAVLILRKKPKLLTIAPLGSKVVHNLVNKGSGDYAGRVASDTDEIR